MTEEEKTFQEVLDKAKELENMNFSKDEDFNFKEYYDAVGKIANENNSIKNIEADNVLTEFAPKYLDKETIKTIDDKKEAIRNLLRKYDPNLESTKEMEIHDIDKIYALSNYLLNSFIQHLNTIPFKFVLTPEEMKFLNRILTKTIEYNADDVFNFIKLYDEFWQKAFQSFNDDKSQSQYEYKINIQTSLILHHLIKEHKVKGSGNDFKHFKSILYQIAETNKLFNAYNVVIERLKEDGKLWGTALDEALKFKDPEYKIIKDTKSSDELPKIDAKTVQGTAVENK